jgi:hypothetical protein
LHISEDLPVIDLSTATALIIILIVGAFVANRIYRRRRNIHYPDQRYANRDRAGNVLTMPGIPRIRNKLKILAGIVTFIVIVIVMAESVVIVQAGHRGVVLYLGAVENRVLGEGVHFIVPFA